MVGDALPSSIHRVTPSTADRTLHPAPCTLQLHPAHRTLYTVQLTHHITRRTLHTSHCAPRQLHSKYGLLFFVPMDERRRRSGAGVLRVIISSGNWTPGQFGGMPDKQVR